MASRNADTVTIAPVMLSRRGSVPVHSQIEQELRGQILGGRWAPGSKLPPEPELAHQFGVNRGTLRRALSALVHAGLLTAQRGRGTFVTDVSTPSMVQRFRSLSEDLADQAISFTTRVISADSCALSPELGTLFGLPASSRALVLQRVFTGEEGPLAYLHNRVRLDYCPGLEKVDFTTRSLFGTLADRYGIEIARGRRSIRACAASAAVAAALEVPAQHPVLSIAQVSYAAGGDAIEQSDVYLNSDKVTISAILERDQPSRNE